MGSRALRIFAWFAALVCTLALESRAGAGSRDFNLVDGAAERQSGQFVASEQGATYEAGRGVTVVLTPGSTFSFHESIKLRLGAPSDPPTRTDVIQLTSGRAEVTASSDATTALLVRAPNRMNGVTKPGGRSIVIAAPDAVTLAAARGEMFVGVGNEWDRLEQGKARTRTPRDRLAAPRDIVTAPEVELDTPLVLVRNGTPSSPVTATWKPVPGARKYRVVAEHDGKVLDEQRVSSHRYELSELPTGTVSVTVTAIDPFGLEGGSSSPVRLRGVGVVLPDSSRQRDSGAIVLGRGDRVTLVGTDGLQLAYNSARYFMDAPGKVGLIRAEPTLIRLRVPGAEHEARLRLEPRSLRARVKLTPKTARWPRDRVRVFVELYNALGGPIRGEPKIETRVTVNLEPIDLDWKRSGTKLTAVVPKAPGKGPWVIRAEVRDADGTTIGRNFLEVAATGEERSSAGKTGDSTR